jgi:hypothetical protein
MEQLLWGLAEVFGGIAAAVALAYWIGYEHGKVTAMEEALAEQEGQP